ncbi:DUF3344 domain-containing protein [Methanosarcina acetivorans]|uniref:DUF3344 domain-containing protein n=1 Tax=Methanosarcina acetivorans TaxID=2214 RepID=UPI001D050E53|nr:DUF3344 domain-containing protein [Methanosarcina acetivorans]
MLILSSGVSVAIATETNDLSIAAVLISPSDVVFAKEANTIVVYGITNSGTENLTNITVDVYASDVSGTVPVNTETISSLAGGGTTTIFITDPTIRDLQGSTVTYTAVIDPDNLIPETNEANNNRSSAAVPVRYNGYKGKRYWEGASDITTKHTYDFNGDVSSSSQPSTSYRSQGAWSNGRTETWGGSVPNPDLPSGSTIEQALLYVAYNWDETPGGYPWWNVSFNNVIIDYGNISTGNGILYTDMSNFGLYADYEYGLVVYDVTNLYNSTDYNGLKMYPYNSTFADLTALYPSTLVIIYQNPNMTRKQIFINEECDELGVSESTYGTTPEEATAYAPFTGMSIDVSNVSNATLYSFAGSAGPDEGNLLFNGNTVATNAWHGDAYTASASVFDVKNYINSTGNEAGIQGTVSGGMDVLQQILVVEYVESVPSALDANLTANVTSGTAPLTVQFTDLSEGNVTNWLWDFGDNTNSTSQNVSHTYNSPGTYTVNLTVTGPEGSDSEVKTDFITVSDSNVSAPVAAFTATPLVGTAPLQVAFTDQSTNSPTEWKWEYNNGSGWVEFSNETNASYSFATAVPYDIQLTVSNSGGSDDETKLHYISVGNVREPLNTVQSGTVSGDLYISSPTTWPATEVNQTFTLPAAAVGNIQWAKLYVNTYSGSAANTYALSSTVKLDGDGDSTYESTLGTETMDIASLTNGASFPLNDHVNKVYSDYEAQYDVTSLISAANPAINVKSEAISGKNFDGRIKGVTLVVAYNNTSSTDQTYYWVNHGGDWSSPANGNTIFDTSGLSSGWVSAESKIRYFSYSDANYTFNGVAKTGSTPSNYSGLNTWDVTDNITAGQSSTLAYSKGSGSYKTTLATLKVKYETPGFSNKVTLGDTSPVSPTLASLNGRLYLAWKGDGNNNLNVMYSADNGMTFGNKYTSSETSPESPALCVHNNSLYIAWKGNGSNYLNVAQVTMNGDNITDFSNKVTLGDTSPVSPALASLNGRLYLAWKGDGNNNLNVMYSADNGMTFGNKYTSSETSPESPALCVHNNSLYIAWKGNGNNYLNVAQVTMNGDNITDFSNKVTLGDTSPVSPALASLNGRLYLAWKGDGNNNLNVMYSADNGMTFGNKYTSPETSPESPALCVHNNSLYIAWKGDGNNNLNVAQVI